MLVLGFLRVGIETEVIAASAIYFLIRHQPALEEKLHRDAHGVLPQLQVVVVGHGSGGLRWFAAIGAVLLWNGDVGAILVVWRTALALISHVALGLQLEKDQGSADLEDRGRCLTFDVQKIDWSL